MSLRTAILLESLGDEAALDVVLLLLSEPEGSNVEAIVKQVELPQATVSRRLQGLEQAGLLEHDRRRKPFRLREPERVTALLRMASELSELLLAQDAEAERRFRDRFA
jgi:DNA-binding transcriptional ArsR family regulator